MLWSFKCRLGGLKGVILLFPRYPNTASVIFTCNTTGWSTQCVGECVGSAHLRHAEACVTTQSGQHVIVHTGVMGMVDFTMLM